MLDPFYNFYLEARYEREHRKMFQGAEKLFSRSGHVLLFTYANTPKQATTVSIKYKNSQWESCLKEEGRGNFSAKAPGSACMSCNFPL